MRSDLVNLFLFGTIMELADIIHIFCREEWRCKVEKHPTELGKVNAKTRQFKSFNNSCNVLIGKEASSKKVRECFGIRYVLKSAQLFILTHFPFVLLGINETLLQLGACPAQLHLAL